MARSARRLDRRDARRRPALLRSQLDALQEPGPDEDPITVTIEARPDAIVARIVSALNA